MTHSNSREKTAERCAGELLWTVSLLPVAPAPRPRSAAQPQTLAELVELALPEPSEPSGRRNAA
jgi:hypothetical protein